MGYQIFTDVNGKQFFDSRDYRFLVRSVSDPYRISPADYCEAIKSRRMKPIFHLFTLFHDETVSGDLTPYLTDDGEMTISYENGMRRKLSVGLINPYEKWSPSPFSGFLWKGQKFALYIGFRTPAAEYIRPAGVFVLEDFELPYKLKNGKYTLNMVDKFGGLDGTVGGKIVSPIEVARGSNIRNMTVGLLSEYKQIGQQFDPTPIHFPISFYSATTPYTITKATNNNRGEIFKSFATMLNSDIFYNEYGNLCYENSQDNTTVNSKGAIWNFTDDDLDILNPAVKVNIQQVYNVVYIEGANIHGNVVDVIKKNTNPKSPTNVTRFEPTIFKVTDENIYSEELANKRADYELFKKSLLPISLNFTSPLIPHLDVNQVVNVFSNKHKFLNSRFLINSISIPISGTAKMSINMTNLEEVAF